MIPGDNGSSPTTQTATASSGAPQRHLAATSASSPSPNAASTQSLPGTTLNEQINGHEGPPTGKCG